MKVDSTGPEEHSSVKKRAQDPEWWSEEDLCLVVQRK